MNNFKLIDDQIETYKRCIETARNLYPHMARIDAALTPLVPFIKPTLMMMSNQILIRVKVERIKDIEPLIESLEASLGIEFDNTHDQAEYSWREFKCEKAPWIRVDAELTADGPECRRVIVGYETVPKYEIKCGEDASQPDAPNPNQTTEDF
jgi:hypothetical protein